jgi:hypothetical protein
MSEPSSQDNMPPILPPRQVPPLLSSVPHTVRGRPGKSPWIQLNQGVLELGLKHALRKVHWRDRRLAFWGRLGLWWFIAALVAFLAAVVQPRLGFDRDAAIGGIVLLGLVGSFLWFGGKPSRPSTCVSSPGASRRGTRTWMDG